MHADFGDWYRSAGLEPLDGATLTKRWAAIEEYSPSRDDVVFLARLFYGLAKSDETQGEDFRKALQTADPLMTVRGRDREVALLAGAELIDVIDRSEDTDLADLAALCLISGAAANLRRSATVKEMPELAAKYLSERPRLRSKISDHDERIGSDDSLFAALKSMEPTLLSLGRELQRIVRDLAIVREESNMLWWLFSEHSRDLGKPWKDLPLPAIPLVAAKELSDLTVIYPGPVAAAAFLKRALQSAGRKYPSSIPVADAIDQLPLEWRQSYSQDGCPVGLETLLPISWAIKASLAAPNDGAWRPMLPQQIGIQISAKLTPELLANQLYRESTLRGLWEEYE